MVAQVEILASATVSARLLEIGLSGSGAVLGFIGFGIPQVAGVTPGGLVTLQAEDQNGPAGNTRLALSWATQPQAPRTFLRQAEISGVIGAGVVWTFPLGLILPISKTAVVWNISAATQMDTWVVADE